MESRWKGGKKGGSRKKERGKAGKAGDITRISKKAG
jgi:hypothetical protein